MSGLAKRHWRDWLLIVAAVAGVVLTARLGIWQLDRAVEKLSLHEQVEQRSQLPVLAADGLVGVGEDASAQIARRASLQGRWLSEHTVFLENRQMRAQPGFFVVTPLLLEGQGSAVLVQRGWAPRDQLDRTRVPNVPTPPGLVTVSGRVVLPPSKLYEFEGPAELGPVRQNVDLPAFSLEIGVPLRPVSLLQTEAPMDDDGLLRDWHAPAVDVAKHHGYAFQWFALCALIAGLYVWFQVIRPRVRRSQ